MEATLLYPLDLELDWLEGRHAWEMDWLFAEKVLVGKKMKMEKILIRARNLRCWGDVFCSGG